MKVYIAAKMSLELKNDGGDNHDYSLAVFLGFFAFHHMEEHGMDHVFYFEKDGIEYNLLSHHPVLKIDDIKLTISTPTDYDAQVLKWARIVLFDLP